MVPPIPPYGEVTTENAKEIVQSQSISLVNATSDEIFKLAGAKKELENPKLTCPFPDNKAYTKLREKLTPDKQKEMKENIRISADGKIEIIKMKKKFSILIAEHNGKDIFKGEHEDKNGNKGII
jgi:hypothetical protein